MSPLNRVMDFVTPQDYYPNAVCLPARPSGWLPQAKDPQSPEGQVL
jgi:hypothetical protein